MQTQMTEVKGMSIDELRKLSQQLIEEPDKTNELTDEQVLEVRKFVSPYGNIVSSDESFINISIINWREEYLRKLTMTALIGYLYRTKDEYEDTDDIELVSKRYDRKGAQISSEITQNRIEIDNLQKKINTGVDVLPVHHTDLGQLEEHLKKREKSLQVLEKQKEAELKMRKRITREIVARFLDRNFNFNPDKHLRGTHSANDKDPERRNKSDLVKESLATKSRAANVETKIKDNPDNTFKYLKGKILASYQYTRSAVEQVKGALRTLRDPENDLEDKLGILAKKHDQLAKIAEDMKKLAAPLASADVIPAIEKDPPIDVFYQFQRYIINHYEQLREVVQHLYNEKPDLEFSAIYYRSFKDKEKARDHRIAHTDEFRAEVLTLSNNGINLLGPFKENRSRVDFYNKNTEILKRMMDQMESDHKLGKDLMEKTLKKQKSKNIAEAGPDAPGLSEYSRTATGTDSGTVQDFGAKKVMSKDEQEQVLKKQREKEMDEVPEEAIQVDVFYPRENDDGDVEMKRTFFYTQAEAPLHMQEGSQFTEQYQPKRAPGEKIKDTLSNKIITDRHGKKIEVKTLGNLRGKET